MKRSKQWISGLLCLAMLLSLCAARPKEARAAGEDLTGSIGLTIRFGLPQSRESVDSREITLTVSGGGKKAVVSLTSGTAVQNDFGAEPEVTAKNTEGVELTTESVIGYYQAELGGLPAGVRYDLTVTGLGYKPYTGSVTLDGYSKHVVIGTSDGTFPLGDVNGDGEVTAADLEDMSNHLETASPLYDLNGDGTVDVTDLAYIEYNIGAEGTPDPMDTAAIVRAEVDTSHLTVNGSIDDLFTPGGAVMLSPAVPGGELAIPITLPGQEGVEMSEIVLTSPEGPGAILAGSVVVEHDQTTHVFDFDNTPPEGVRAIGRSGSAGEKTVHIALGNRVAVKKITIIVKQVEGGAGFAAVTQIEFLKDIVPDAPQKDATQVNGVTAVEGNGTVELAWNAVRNITGYSVAYGTNQNALDQTLEVNTNRAAVTGLENLKQYFFQVTATNQDWRGTPSCVISATPQPASAPGAPSNIRVESRDQALRVSWGKTKDASYYQLFYREAGSSDFQQSGGDLTATSAVITGLTNGVPYEIAVKAGNLRGTGPYSATAAGTPDREDIELPELPADGRIPNSMVESIKLTNANNVDRSLCPNFQTGHLIDSDASTYWVARVWWESSEITYTFSQPQDMNYLILVPYLQGAHRNAITRYTITTKDEEGNVLSSGTYSAPRMTEKNYLVLPFPAASGVKSLSLALAEWDGAGARVSTSEIAFYTSDGLPEDIAALFANESFTQLRPGVTEEEIAALESRLNEKSSFYLDLALLQDELALARGLLADSGSALGVVRSGFQSRSPGQDAAFGQSASALQPLGVSVAVPDGSNRATARTPVAVYAELPGDAPVYVVPTQFFGESGIWSGAAIELRSGRNYIDIPQIGSLTDQRGGPLYITYAGSNPEAIKLQVRGGSDVSAIPVLELSGWYDLSEEERTSAISAYVEELERHVASLTGDLATNICNATEISTPSVLLSIPAGQALAGLKGAGRDAAAMAEIMYQGVLAWEDELFVANKVQGIIDSNASQADYRYPMTTRQNIRYMRMFAGAFMYAAGNHVGVGYGSTAGLVQGRPVSATGQGNTNGLFGWGIAHEIGHNMDKLGKAEITNNIYSLAIQAWDGGAMTQNTRLTSSGIWNGIYSKVSAGRPGPASNVFVQLGMYWQLHLAYDGAEEPLAFYNRFFSLWKSGEYSGFAYNDRVALIAAGVVQRDLTEFFTRWGVVLGDEAKEVLSQYAPEPRAIWYLNDDSRTYRLSGGAGGSGEASVTANVEENIVTLELSSTGSALLGYEIRRNGKPIGFTTADTYTDDLGAANNLTYTYSAVPVDRLGNMGAEAKANEVRVAWDTTISADLYTTAWEGNALTITMKDGAVPVTGIKVAGLAGPVSCTVSIKADAAAGDWTTARTGEISDGVAYFNKPGVGPEDARIWTYDAAVLRITGLPADASVTLLDYPGDRIDFYEGAVAGKLAEEYRYDGGSIPAGTLVVLGTYRGDPVYNTVELQGRFTTAAEGGTESETIERPISGYALLFAEIPEDGQVSDISDGFFLFVPNLDAEEELNEFSGVTGSTPSEIRVVLCRTDDPNGADRPDGGVNRRVTSETLWVSFPELGDLPGVFLNND